MTPELTDVDGLQVVTPSPNNPRARQFVTGPIPEEERDLERARFTVVERLYHQQVGEKPFAFELQHQHWLDSRDEHYSRHCKAGEQWQPLDPSGNSWVREAVQLVVSNEEGHFRRVNPTPEEKAAVAARVLELGLFVGGTVVPFATLHPTASLRFEPIDPTLLRVRCRSGVARYWLILVPR